MSSLWMKLLFSLAVIAILLLKLDISQLAMIGINDLFFACLAIQPFVFVGLIFHAIRLGLLAGIPCFKIRRPISALLLSQGLNLLIPGRVAELFKATYLRTYADVPIGKGMAAIVLERSVDLLIVAALGLIAVALLSSTVEAPAFILAIIVVVGLFTLPLMETYLLSWTKLLPWLGIRRVLETLLSHLVSTVRARSFYQALFFGLLSWASSFVNIYVFVNLAGSRPVGLEGILLLFVATTLGGAVPGLPGGFGGYEAAAIFALKPYGYSFEEALSLGIGMHLAQYIIPALGACVVLSMEKVGIADLVMEIRKKINK